MTIQSNSQARDVESDPTAVPLRVLLVDDIPENLILLTEVLHDQGYETILAASGTEALQQLDATLVHIIVADAMMPSIDGFQLCREVKQSPKFSSIPFIIYTGNYVDTEDQNFAKSIGVDAYVMKYDGLSKLVDSIKSLATECYGPDLVKQNVTVEGSVGDSLAGAPLDIDGQMFLERHHAIIVKKLEEKMHELEVYAETLSRKNLEIHASEARYRNLFEHASVGIFVLDRQKGKILDVNGEGLSLLGYRFDEIDSITPLSFVGDPDVSRALLQSGGFFSRETTFVRKDGAKVEVELGAGPFTEQSDSKILLYVLDITDQKKMREHLLQSEKMAFMGRLVASIAHDIRNPLAAITLNLQYIAKRLPADFKDRASLDFALEGGQRIGKVIENTLNLARVTPPNVRPEQINKVVESAISFLNTVSAQKQIVLQLNLDANLPHVDVEAKQIEQVILNLVQNAIDASPELSTVMISTCLMEDLQGNIKKTEKIAVVVLDRGAGITPEGMKQLFEPFHTTKPGGTGLGLALSKQIMDKHNSEIRIEPAVGGGTIARLIFPVNNSMGGEN